MVLSVKYWVQREGGVMELEVLYQVWWVRPRGVLLNGGMGSTYSTAKKCNTGECQGACNGVGWRVAGSAIGPCACVCCARQLTTLCAAGSKVVVPHRDFCAGLRHILQHIMSV